MVKLVAPLHSTEARGSVGEVTYNTYRGRSYAKTRVGPSQQYSARQVAIRAFTAQATSLWQTMTSSQRSLWDRFAAEHPDQDWTGSPKRLTGYNWFVRINCVALDAGLSTFVDPPTYPSGSEAPQLTLSVSAGHLRCSAATTDSGLTLSGILDIWVSDIHSPAKHPSRKNAKHLLYGASDTPYDLGAIAVGEARSVWARWIDPADGSHHPWSLARLVAPPTDGSADILVVDDGSGGIPLSGVTVFVGAYSNVTGVDGTCTITGIPAGTYSCSATKVDYTTWSTSGQIVPAGGVLHLGTAHIQPME